MIDRNIYLKEENLYECFKMFANNDEKIINKENLKKELIKNEYYQNKEDDFFVSLI